MCCSVLQCVAVCCNVQLRDAVWCSVLQCVAVCCHVLRVLQCRARHVSQCIAVCCSVLQCVAVCCSLLQCVAVFAVDVAACTHASCECVLDSCTCVTWYMHICDMTSYVTWLNAWQNFMCNVTEYVTCLNVWHDLIFDITRSHVWHDTCIYVRWLVICDVNYSHVCVCVCVRVCVWRDSFIRVTSLLFPLLRVWMRRVRVWHDSFICVTWHFHMCDMAHSYVTWPIRMYAMTHAHVSYHTC